MYQTERIEDPQLALRVAFDGVLAGVWTALPGVIVSYDATKGTCVVQPTIEALVTDSSGNQSWQSLPALPDVPVVFLGGGGFVATFPIQKGDEALVIFSSRCIDSWFQYGGVQPQADLRKHDLSDGFAIIGPRSLPNALANVSTTAAQLRSVDGSAYIELAPGGVANIDAPGGINLKGDVAVTGTISATGEGTFNSIEVSQHVHSGVASGGADTGPPVG